MSVLCRIVNQPYPVLSLFYFMHELLSCPAMNELDSSQYSLQALRSRLATPVLLHIHQKEYVNSNHPADSKSNMTSWALTSWPLGHALGSIDSKMDTV